MWVDISILVFFTLLAGFAVFLVPKLNSRYYSLSLVFAGAYLFSITIVHIMPELFAHDENRSIIGLWVLVGFFFQLILEYFTQGVEHGHLHHHSSDHNHGSVSSLSLMIALFFHAFLEGTLLAHPNTIHAEHDSSTLLAGIIMHKMPAAFALMSVLICTYSQKWKSIVFLIVFALASPLGLFVSGSLHSYDFISDQNFMILFAVVSGNFLHISTTIFFESSPEHRFHFKKLLISIIAAAVAVSAELLF